MLKPLIDWYLATLESGGYLLIGLLMAIESSIVPLPSEAIITPAAIVASQSGKFTYTGIIIAGTIGSWVGASVMYWLSRWAGRPIVMRIAAWQANHPVTRKLGALGPHLIITPEKIEKAERWSAQFGSYGIFVARLLPVVRHLIGIPAGVVRMNFLTYSIFTLLGSAVWCSVLVWVGKKAGNDPALMNGEIHQLLFWILGAVGILGVIYYLLVHRLMRSR